MNSDSIKTSEADMYVRLQPVFEEVFDQDVALTPEMTAGDIDGWDSLGNIRLFVSIEQELSIQFTSGEISNLSNVGELITCVVHKIYG